MGYDAACTLHFDGQTTRGKAFLEQNDLIFRGPVRLAIPLKDITSAVAGDGALTVRFGRRTATFDLGIVADKWASRITNPPSRLDKLGVKTGMAVLAAGTLHEDLLEEIGSRGVRLVKRVLTGATDIVFYGADRREALERLPQLKRALKQNGALWIIRPKGSQAITESEVMEAGKEAGLVDVKVVSFSPTHTAEKFVIPRNARQQ
jgi:Protein of unknown function (DUF3052)